MPQGMSKLQSHKRMPDIVARKPLCGEFHGRGGAGGPKADGTERKETDTVACRKGFSDNHLAFNSGV